MMMMNDQRGDDCRTWMIDLGWFFWMSQPALRVLYLCLNLSPPPPHRHRWADSVRILGSAGKRKLQLLLFAPRAEFRVRISAFGSITSNSRSNFPFRCFSVFGMQELIAQSSPDRCLDSIPQTVQLHDVKRGVKSTGQWAKHVCLENSATLLRILQKTSGWGIWKHC